MWPKVLKACLRKGFDLYKKKSFADRFDFYLFIIVFNVELLMTFFNSESDIKCVIGVWAVASLMVFSYYLIAKVQGHNEISVEKRAIL